MYNITTFRTSAPMTVTCLFRFQPPLFRPCSRLCPPRLLDVRRVLLFLNLSFCWLDVPWQGNKRVIKIKIKPPHGKMVRKQAALVQRTTRRGSLHPVQPLLPTTNNTAPVEAAAPRARGINVERTPGKDGMTGERPPMVLLVV